MKLAAARALAALAKEDVPDSVIAAYGGEPITFGQEYLIPKPLDPRVLLWEAPAVAEAAIKSGVASLDIDIEEYRDTLTRRQGLGRQVKRFFINKARQSPKRIVFGEGEEPKIIRAAAQIIDEGIGQPILIGAPERIEELIEELNLDLKPEIVNRKHYDREEDYAQAYYDLRKRKGITLHDARVSVHHPFTLGPMMVYMGDADAYVAGLSVPYANVIRPALQLFHTRPGVRFASGVYLVLARERVFVFTDATVNLDTDADKLAEIAILANDFARTIEMDPVVALLSFSNFGATPHADSEKVQHALEIVRERRPDICIDGEVQADFAVNGALLDEHYPFAEIRDANVLVFPDLGSANIAYKLLNEISGAETIGPILLGMGAPVHVLPQGTSVENIVAMAAVAAMDAQQRDKA
jgi:malate dehydrogenase (oxaloacetate-decarboxylating)(NADP+)